jgi:hypothetical protein
VAVLSVASAIAVGVAASALGSSAVSDPRGDVLSCTGECSSYDQDLKALSLTVSGGQLLITVHQYGTSGTQGPFTQAQKLYWPQVDIYTTRPENDAPDFPYLAAHPADYYVYVGYSSGTYAMQLVHVSTGGWNAGHQVVKASVPYTEPDQNSVTYKVSLADLGNPGSVRVRAWQGGTSDPGSHKIVDVVPDYSAGGTVNSDVLSISTRSGGSTGFGSRTRVAIAGAGSVPVHNGIAAIPIKNSNRFRVHGKLSLATSAALAHDVHASAVTIVGSKRFAVAATKTIKVDVGLSSKARNALKKNGKLKVTATAVLHDPAGHTRTITRTLTLTKT